MSTPIISSQTAHVNSVNWNGPATRPEHIGVYQDGGGRYHWTHVRPHGCTTASSESFATYAEACAVAVRVAPCYGLPVDPAVALVAGQSEMESAFQGVQHRHITIWTDEDEEACKREILGADQVGQ